MAAVALLVLVLEQHHSLVSMADQEHQVDQDLVVVKMVMIMDLLVLVQAVLQAAILVRLVEAPVHQLVVEAVVLALLVMMEVEVIPGMVVLVEQVSHSPQHS